MPLKTTTKAYLHVEYKDLENFITAHYGLPYSVIRGLEAHNGALHAVKVSANYEHYDPDAEAGSHFTWREGLDPEVAETLGRWRAGTLGYDPYPGALLHDLACSGHLEPGEYLINVAW
ncbi:hypothetical protein [Streptomyces sp. WM6378]|uniref:hypothetical protein n=1 Tax=Streptomyces sp. WM6378 TaxID=1415557 RepID=UPI0006AEDEE8|nr:hypothetical protein [Streptomyces sp. WM6378]KOU43609.1 hypothetical protein ADK54_17625 [Streptomyces sp. WM6378]